jgi:DNA-binding MltR family transcriptional regulator
MDLWTEMTTELEAESDRGCILVGASALEVYLEELLRTSFVADAHVAKHAVEPLFQTMGPLSTFSAKIKLAYGVGLLTKREYTNLEKIRRIRNIASHVHSSTTFESPKILEINRTLETGLQEPPPELIPPLPDPNNSLIERARFIITVAFAVVTMEYRIKRLKRRTIKVLAKDQEVTR